MPLRLMPSLCAAALLLVCLLPLDPASARSAAEEVTMCGEECAGIIETWLNEEQALFFPLLTLPAERFDAEDIACAATREATPLVHAVVVAPSYDDYMSLPGTQNDANLWRSLLEHRGIEPANLHVLDGKGVTREAIITAMRAIVPCVKDRDQVIVAFSGAATSYSKWGYVDAATFLERKCADEAIDAASRAKVCSDEAYPSALQVTESLAGGLNEQVLLSSETRIADGNEDITQLADGDLLTGIASRELSNFATQVQNRGADIIFVLDSSYAEDFNLVWQQQRVGNAGPWRWERGTDTSALVTPDTVDLFGSGALAALYATRSKDQAFETEKTGEVVLGELTFAVAEALRSMQNPTIEQLSREIDRTMEAEGSEQIPVFEATNPALRFMSPREAVAANPDQIEMINPKLTRGAAAIDTPEVEVVARYSGTGQAAFASIDGLNVEIEPNGQFRRAVSLKSRTEIPVRVFGRDASVLAERSILFGDDAVTASLAPVGRRLALVIGNKTYVDPAFPTLRTPADDATSVQQMLADKFGFTTKLDTGNGKSRDLLLIDATKMDILKALSDLRKNLTAEDQLVIFYAGHGVVDSEQTSYWVPVDASREDYSWIRAFDITEELRKISSGSVLLISDSCYAGGLSRDIVLPPAEDARDRYLAKSTRYKARQLIASGGNEPVADGGGKGHSLFAQALLDAMTEMPETVFTANELFEAKIKPKVISAAFATSAKGQTPVFYRITHAGDEPESEFVFVRR